MAAVDAGVEDGDRLPGTGVAGGPGIVRPDQGDALGKGGRRRDVLLEAEDGRVGDQVLEGGRVELQRQVGDIGIPSGQADLEGSQPLEQDILRLTDSATLVLGPGGAEAPLGAERQVQPDDDAGRVPLLETGQKGLIGALLGLLLVARERCRAPAGRHPGTTHHGCQHGQDRDPLQPEDRLSHCAPTPVGHFPVRRIVRADSTCFGAVVH